MNLEQFIFTAARRLLLTGQVIKSEKWQGVKLDNAMMEAIKVYLGPAIMPTSQNTLVKLVKPNLPWAEDHFKERVGGKPLNPGDTYQYWPYYSRDKEMRNSGELFTHTYMERFWPKFTGQKTELPNAGIRYFYGDYDDVVTQLITDPYTRQAFLPIFFPEDTGAIHGGRVPCTLGYLFQYRNNHLHLTYYIRSCDFIRHFRDDIYMAVRLAQDCLLKLKLGSPEFSGATLGSLDMHIGSLHIFEPEVNRIAREFNL